MHYLKQSVFKNIYYYSLKKETESSLNKYVNFLVNMIFVSLFLVGRTTMESEKNAWSDILKDRRPYNINLD